MSSIRANCIIDHFQLDVSFDWNGRSLGIFGPSGSGKTMLLEILTGIRKATGRALIQDQVLYDTTKNFAPSIPSRRIGWVPQDSSLFPHMTCRENVLYGARNDVQVSIEELLAKFELQTCAHVPAPNLSGGEKIRTAIARAIASRPKILLFDEPMAGLDVPLRHRVLPYLKYIHEELDIPMIYVSHHLDEIWSLTDDVVILEKGRVVASGPTIPTLESAEQTRLEDALDQINTFPVDTEPSNNIVKCFLPSKQMLYANKSIGKTEEIRVRPDEILLTNDRPKTSARNYVEGTVQSIREMRGATIVEIDAGEIWSVRITEDSVADLGIREGEKIGMIFKASAVRRS